MSYRVLLYFLLPLSLSSVYLHAQDTDAEPALPPLTFVTHLPRVAPPDAPLYP